MFDRICCTSNRLLSGAFSCDARVGLGLRMCCDSIGMRMLLVDAVVVAADGGCDIGSGERFGCAVEVRLVV